jgi:SOS-response transcriptional repressor LexA
MDYKDRLRWAMSNRKPPATRKDLSLALGISVQAVGLVVRGETGSFTAENNARAAKLLGVNASWLATGKGEPIEPTDQYSNVSPGPQVKGLVPLLNKISAGMYQEIIDQQQEVEQIPTVAPTKRYTFALRVEGDSMEPTFPPGMVVIIEPELDPLPNDFVVAVNGDNEATFKQLIKDGADWLLKPLNPRYPIKPLGTARVVGVCIGAHIMFKRGEI